MQNLLQEHPESNPLITSATKKLQDIEAQPLQSKPDAQEENKSAAIAETTETSLTVEPPTSMGVTPPVESEPAVKSQAESGDTTAKPNVPTKAGPNAKTNPGCDGQIMKKQNKGVNEGKKYVLSKKAMVDPLKMDMSKPVVMPLTSSQLSLQCIECHIIFSDHKSKERHLKLSHPAEYEQCILRNALFACYVCDRHFPNSTELMVHQKAHTEKKPFKCPICSQAFKKLSELTVHKKVHFGEDGYACTECGKTCKTLTLLKYHQRKHTGDKPYVCKECGQRFVMGKTLQQHMVSHLPEGSEEARAEVRPKAQKQKSNAIYPCPHCKVVFKTSRTRNLHVTNIHKIPAFVDEQQLKRGTPIITPISISQPSMLQVEPNGPLQKVDANIDTEQIRKLIESLGNVQKVNQVVILGQVPPHAPPLEIHHPSEPAELANLNLSPPQIDFIGPKETESNKADLDPSVDPMEQTIILEPITPEGHLENPSFSDLASHLTVGENIELTLIEAEQTERPEGEVMQIPKQSENTSYAEPMVFQNEVDDLNQNLEQTVILELTPALIPTEELEQSQNEQQKEIIPSTLALHTDQSTPDQTACRSTVDELETILTVPSFMPTVDLEQKCQHSEQKELSSCLSPPYVQAPNESETIKEDSYMEAVGIDQGPEQDKKTQDWEERHLFEKLPVKDKNTMSEEKDPSAKESELLKSETKEAPQNSELPVNVMSAQELVKVRKRKPARTFFFQGYMHDLVSSIYKDDYQFDAKPAKRQRTKKSHIVVKFGPQNMDKKSKKQKKPPQQHQPISDDLTKVKTSPKKLSEKKVQTQKKKAKGKKEKKEGNVLTGREVKSPSSPAQQAQQIKDSPSKNKMKKQKVAKESVAHTSEHKTVTSPMFKKKKQTKLLRKDQPKSKKTGKGKKNLAIEQVGKSEEPGSNVNKDSLLLLKGHKQPQLKVYKLDTSKASNQTPETSPQSSKKVSRAKKPSDNFTAEGKKKGGRSKKNQKALSLLSSKKVSNQPPETVPTKPKTTRKRKSSSNVETEGVITSKRALECKDCGESFSDVSSFQKHKTSAHIVESPSLTYTNGNIFEGVSTLDLYQLPKGHNKIVRVMSAPTDWDTEPEMALEDRERSVSFPALIPSPSLPIPPTDIEMATYEDGSGGTIRTNDQSNLCLEVQSPFSEIKSKETLPNLTPESPFPASIHPKGSETGEPLGSSKDKQEDDSTENPISEFEMQGTTEEDVKEDLLLEVDLVTVGEQNERDDPVSHPEGVDQNESNEDSGPAKHPGQVGHQTPENCLTSQTVSCSTHEVEVKEEEEETLVQKTKEVGEGDSTRDHQRRGRTSNTSSAEDKPRDVESENEQDDCQVVFEKHCPSSDLEKANCGIGTQTSNQLNALKSPVPSLPYTPVTIEESSEKPIVFELESLSTSVDEVMKEGEEHERESDQSPGNILERFLTSRQRAAADKDMCLMTERSNQRQTSDSNAENDIQVLEDPDIKVEESNSQPLMVMPTCQNLQSNSVQPEHHRSIRSVLVKEESRSLLNDPQGGRRMRWNLETAGDENTDIPLIESMETTGSCRLTPELNSNQCIFYPVKEEEREVLLGSTQASRGSSTPDGSSNINQTADCEPYEKRPSPPISSQETIVRGPPSDPGLGDFTEEQAASDSEWQAPPGLRDFLLQNSDEEDMSGFELSEPQLDKEAEILEFFNQNQTSSEHPNNLSTSTDQQQSPSVENRTREPIDYFSQYFGWDTWVEIATSTNHLPNILSPVTYREVARFVGIHIAMGTLKFPSPRLYWDDSTKVLLISEAMSLTRFLELSRMLKLTSSRNDLTSSNSKSQQHGETCLSDQSVTSQSGDGQHEGDISNSLQNQTDPLWKVQPLLCRFNAGCQWLRRQGDYAVDQYSLPLMGKNHDNSPSLQCTTLTGLGGFLTHVDLKVDLSDKEDAVEKMVPRGSMIFLCKQELSTPSMLERLLAAGVHGAGKVGGPRGQIGDEFVSSNGKLMLRRSYCGFLLSTSGNGRRNMASLIDSFEKAQTLARLSRNLQGLYSTPLTASAPTCWPQAVLWYLTDAALVNSWLLYRQNHRAASAPLTFMAFRLEVSKALIHSSSSDTHDSGPPQPPSEKTHKTSETPNPVLVEESPLPDATTRYDGSGHWPEQLSDGEGGKCRFGDCQRMSRVLCLKCCVFLCISRNHNCFLNFHSQGSLGK
uniref:Zinc finger n=1 Tax=Iconisemion striatum TaxID=60296 RepID=A0A1A7WF71_9TELE